MVREPGIFSWVTPLKYVGPLIVISFVVTALLAVWFATYERFNEAIITLLFTISFILLGIWELLWHVLIMLSGKRAQPPGAEPLYGLVCQVRAP